MNSYIPPGSTYYGDYEPHEPHGLFLWRLKKLDIINVWAIIFGIIILVISAFGIYFWE